MELDEITSAELENLKSQGYSEQDLSLLSADEARTLLPIISTDEDAARADPHELAQQQQDDGEAAAAAAAATAAEEAAAAVQAAADSAAAAPAPPPAPIQPPAEIKAQIDALKSEEREAFKKLMDGEIESEAYLAIKDRVEGEVDTLKDQAANAQRELRDAQEQWSRAESAQFTVAKTEGLDYRGKPALLAAYNTHLRALGADPKNEKRDAPWFLAEAHRLTKEDLGIKTPAKKTSSGVDIAELPPTLRSVPVAATGALNTDEFSHMRNLEGIELERAHASLTDAQRDRWMNS